MTDWADEIAESLIHDDYNEDGPAGVYANASEIAHALRAAELRGRVKGMREAADDAQQLATAAYGLDAANMFENFSKRLIRAATKLESSPTT